MRTYPVLVLMALTVFINLSCHRNRLKTNEKDLAKEILSKEKDRTLEQSENSLSSESMNEKSGTLRQKEIRKVDPEKPPVYLDISGTMGNTRKLKLSDVAKSIRYIKLQTPPDTLLLYDPFFYRTDLESNIRADGENIIFQGLFGLSRFNMKGEYQETIWKNETGISFYGKGVMFGGKDFFGILFNVPVSLSNGNLYFGFQDGPAGTGQVMKYKPGSSKKLPVESQTEIQEQAAIPGDKLFNTKEHPFKRFSWIYGLEQDSWAGINNVWNAGISGTLLVTFNDKGDTVCQFSDYERIVNYSLPQGRGAVNLASYSFNGLLTLKPEYNDTVFRLIKAERLLPAYVINFGKNKISFLEGLNPDFDLSGKYLFKSLHETAGFLFIRYTQNNDSPNNRKKNSVKFYNALFDKKEGKTYHQPGFTLVPSGLINDLDGGIPFWPDYITPQDEMMKLVSGRAIMDYVNSEGFKTANISEENRRKQISMASGLRPTDMVIVIVK